MTNAEARFNNSLRPRKPEGSLGRTAQDGHLDPHTAPELCGGLDVFSVALRPQRPQGLLGTVGGREAGEGGGGGGQVHLIVFHTAPELCGVVG